MLAAVPLADVLAAQTQRAAEGSCSYAASTTRIRHHEGWHLILERVDPDQASRGRVA
jgi:hypothetical protein